MNYQQTGQTPPLIGHVEVGGTLGGSFVALGRYLKYCDPQRFRHEVVFFKRPEHIDADQEAGWPIIDLGLPIRPLSAPVASAGMQAARNILVRMPRLRALLQDFRSIWRLLHSLPQALRLAKIFRKYDLIHCNNNYGWQPQTVLAARLAGKPLVGHYRTIHPVSWLERRLARVPKCLAVINNTGADHLRKSGIRTPIVICPDIIKEPEAFTAQEQLTLRTDLAQTGDLLVGTVSRLEDSKGIQDLLTALRILQPQWPQLGCVIVGDGSRAEDYKHMAVEMGLRDKVHFTGFVSNQFVYYPCMEVFVCPSLAEGGPLTVVEAMQMGCPVVATRVGQIPEWIRNGENGLIVAPADPESLARAIESLLANPGQRTAMAARGKETIDQFMDPLTCARELDGAFARVMARSGGACASSPRAPA